MDHLETEGRNPASEQLDALSSLDLVRLMQAEDQRVLVAVATQAPLIAQAIEIIADRLAKGGRLVYVGAGTSGRLGVLDASECPPTFSSPPEQVVGLIAGGPTALTRAVEGAEDHPEQGAADLASISFGPVDVLVGIAASGRTPYVLGAVQHARSLGAFTIGLACVSAGELSGAVDLAIAPVVGPEILSGSTRLKAGTATKLVLNTLTTGAMVRLGKTYGNLMVDLRATNAKLRARTNRIVRQLTGLDHAQADALLQAAGGELKTALVMHLTEAPADEVRRNLAAVGGQIRKVLPTTTIEADDHLTLGIDGGGTHTVALLARDGQVIGRGEAGPANRQAVGDERAFQAIDEAVTNAFRAAGEQRRTVGRSCLGLAGAGRPEDRAIIEGWATRGGLARQVRIVADVALLLAAGTPAGWGLAVVAGTGSIAWGQRPDGQQVRAGGWGSLLGDEGSAHALGLSALRALVAAEDGLGPATALTDALMNHLKIQKVSELIPLLHGGPLDRAALAGLAPIVVEHAARDTLADQLVQTQAEALARTARAALVKLNLSVPVPLALAGGMFLHNESYRNCFLTALSDSGACLSPVTLVREPAEGALRLASFLRE